MNNAFLLTGGNLGNRKLNLSMAKSLVEVYGGQIINCSAIYETAAWGYNNQPDFYNQALQIETTLSPESLLQKLLQIESEIGRERSFKMGPRIIDIDILLYNDDVVNTSNIMIPHPYLAERRFALKPLAEIAPDKLHPILKKTVLQLLNECNDKLPVHKISDQ